MTPQQIVDVLRAVETGGSLVFATAEEVDRFGGPVAVAQTRYAELKLEMPPAQASAVAQAEMVATMLGADTAGILEEVERRFDLQRQHSEKTSRRLR